MRQVDGQSSEAPGTETTALAPGDTIKVTMPLPEHLDQQEDAAAAEANAIR